MGTLSLKNQTAASVPNAATGTLKIFVDSADSVVKTKDESGAVSSIGGSLSLVTVVTNGTSPYSANIKELVPVDVSGGNVTINLPSAASLGGQTIYVKLVSTATPSTNECTVDPNGAETIDGVSTVTLDTDYEWIGLASDGTNWMQIA